MKTLRQQFIDSIFWGAANMATPAELAQDLAGVAFRLGQAWRKHGYPKDQIFRATEILRAALEGRCKDCGMPLDLHEHGAKVPSEARKVVPLHFGGSPPPGVPTTRRAPPSIDDGYHCGGPRCALPHDNRGPCSCVCFPCAVVNVTQPPPPDTPSEPGSPPAEGSQAPDGANS